MEANREAAETCVVRAEAALREQDFAKTLRLLVKAKSLYPLDNLEAEILVENESGSGPGQLGWGG